jgi:N-acetyl-beta-hexosaminidase
MLDPYSGGSNSGSSNGSGGGGLAASIRNVGLVILFAITSILGYQFWFNYHGWRSSTSMVWIPGDLDLSFDRTSNAPASKPVDTYIKLVCGHQTNTDFTNNRHNLEYVDVKAGPQSPTRLLLFPVPKVTKIGVSCLHQDSTIGPHSNCGNASSSASTSQLFVFNNEWLTGNHPEPLVSTQLYVNDSKIAGQVVKIWDRFCTKAVGTQVPRKAVPKTLNPRSPRRRQRKLEEESTTQQLVESAVAQARIRTIFVDTDLVLGASYGPLQEFQRKEFYKISVSEAGVIDITATTDVGVQHALITVIQLLTSPLPIHLPIIIEDWPSLAWRGLQIDTARHFQPIPLLKRTVDALEASKMNVLHLHLTDSQSFPILLDDVPRTQRRISMTSNETHASGVLISGAQVLPLSKLGINGSFCTDKLYTLADLRELDAYARERNIEIIPEIDVPAHTLAWQSAFPSIVVICPNTARNAETPHNIYALDPSNPFTMEVVEAVLTQIASTFGSRYVHIGGDEVNVQCWKESSSLSAYAKERSWSVDDIFRDFEKQVIAIIRDLGKTPIVWQGVWDLRAMPPHSSDNDTQTSSGHSNHTVVQPWKCWSGLATRTAAAAAQYGHPIVMAACWYLDYNEDWTSYLTADPIGQSKAIVASEFETKRRREEAHQSSIWSNRTGYKTQGRRHLLSHDEVEPTGLPASAIPVGVFGADHNRRQLLSTNEKNSLSQEADVRQDYFLGGEGNMWTERVDHSNLECRLWPRTTAVAARLWGLEFWQAQLEPRNKKDTSQQTTLSVEDTKHILMSYVHSRHVLESTVNIDVAPLLFHYAQQTKNSKGSGLVPIRIRNISDALLRIDAATNTISLASKASGYLGYNSDKNNFFLTSVCMGIPEIVQRPTKVSRISVAHLNIAEGSTGARGAKMLQWLQRKAAQGVVAVGLCELNGWQEVASSNNNLVDNIQIVTARAANAGFSHAYLMQNSQPYNIGIVSTLPFTIEAEYGPPLFQRGVLHVYITKLALHVLVVHLHAHDSTAREKETSFIREHIIDRGIRANYGRDAYIVVMGDMNSLSSVDAR